MKRLFLFFCIFSMTQVAWCDNQPNFKVEISIDKTHSFNLKPDENVALLYVNTKVTNISNKDQEIITWTQYGWNWVTNNSSISPGKEAAKNGPTQRILKPGQEFSAIVEMFVGAKRSIPLSFRLGFSPIKELPGQSWMDIHKSEGIIWSNEVVLDK